ncbi:DUF6708 domain-containing protein [Pseudomonas sp. MN1F]|uniref:DUF6708 domain-containing protein n=1 Tax=Pseudomonas sp. MN1F TaxID=1366632 RepID=UPI002114FF39|nr:DUF6708 domain-containing protein [Pseudomonas sp. MN1F]
MEFLKRELGWKYDLPTPSSPSELSPETNHVYPTPNHICEDYIEIPRSFHRLRGYSSIVGGFLLLAFSAMILWFIFDTLTRPSKVNFELTTTIIGSYLLLLFSTIPYIRMDIECPRDEPIRFNRQRQKVYFYQYRFDRLHPLGRKNWGVKPVAYDWKDLTLEVYRIYAPMGYGGLLEKVMISVRKPGTDEVIDRMHFADSLWKGEQYWAIVRRFMHEGPGALPDFYYAPTDWHCDNPHNPFDRLLPKVNWPTEMDVESRTAPASVTQP